jgi:hypothetical protein
MGTVTTSLREQAQSIFDDLGYSVTSDGSDLRAERKWRVVHVTPMRELRDPPSSGPMRCFVTREDMAPALERRLTDADPDYEWAIISVRDTGNYDVTRQTV